MPDSVATTLKLHLQQIHNPAVKTAKTRDTSKNLDNAGNKRSRKQTGEWIQQHTEFSRS